MVEHVNPTGFKRVAMRFEIDETRKLDALERAFVAQHGNELLLFWPSVSVSVEVHNVIEIARPGSLSQGPKLFGERLDIVVGEHFDPVFGHVRVEMEYVGADRRQ